MTSQHPAQSTPAPHASPRSARQLRKSGQAANPGSPRNPAAASTDTVAEQLGLHPGQSVELLKELHILTREGKLNQDSRRKLKQVNHLLQFIEPLLQQVLDAQGDVTLADHGAGKSYLGFML